MFDINRRELLKQAATLAAATSIASRETAADAQTPAGPAPVERFFPGFTRSQVKTTGATINVVKGGQGPPLLLIHGAPQTYITWRLVAPMFAKTYTVVAPDLRGY